MKRQFAFAWMASGLALMLLPFSVFLKTSASNSISKAVAPELARLGDRATVHAVGLGAPRINLADGRELLTAYAGDPEAQRLLQQNLAQPLAIASSDFDEDGVPDLVTGYAAPNGGVLTLHRGNVDSIYPNTLEAQQRRAAGTFTNAPFLSPARALETPRPGDFIGCGDFDADGHWDVVTAARGGRALHFFLGDGHGNLSAARQLELSGTVTALATGEINRADGLTDLIVGIAAAGGPQALVFEGPEGALRAKPETFALPAVATAMALGRLDDDYTADLVVAAGSDLIVVYGRDRKLSMGEIAQRKVPRARISRRSLAFAVRSLAIGNFKGDQTTGLSLLTDKGNVHLLRRTPVNAKEKKEPNRIERWKDEILSTGYWPLATAMVTARVSSVPSDSLVIVDSGSEKLHVIAASAATRQQKALGLQSVSFDVEGAPIAVLPMRLNSDALSDLVILRKGGAAPSVAITSLANTFNVSSSGDNGGVDPAPNGDTGTLRQAIVDSNATVGADTITFSIGTGQQTINVLSALPDITEAVTIDGTTQPGFAGTPLIELNGGNLNLDGLTITAAGCTIRGLVVNRFDGSGGIVIQGAGATGTLIEGNFIGTNNAGIDALPNGGDGVFISGAPNTVVGGTTAAARNLISGNGNDAINHQGVNSSGTLIQGNFMGTDVTGTSAVPNNNSAVFFFNSSNNIIGGTAPGAGNVISGTNGGDGVSFDSSTTNGNMVQGNFIGTNAAGTAALGNGEWGVNILASGTAVGGTAAGAGNRIAFNVLDGVIVASGVANAIVILSNSIFSNGELGIDLSPDGVTPNDLGDGDSGPNNLQNFPEITSAMSSGTNTTIQGTLNSAASTDFTIEFFANPACDPSGNGEGETFLGSTLVTTNGSGNANINVILASATSLGEAVTATATDPSGNTSEFSQCVTVTALGTGSDLQITKSDSPDPVVTGSNITYTIAVTNNGPDPDPGATFTDIVPAGTTFVSLTSPGTCTTPPVGSTGTVACSLGALASGGSVTITLVVNVNAAPGATITNTATASGMSSDSNPGNNSATANTAVISGTCTLTCPLDLFASTSPTATSCSTPVSYPLPAFAGDCGALTCAPSPGSVFAVGTTTVNCSLAGGSSCSFSVTVVDETPPRITCLTGFTALLPAGQSSAVVNYPAATASDNCTAASVQCVPPPGATFPAGSTLVTCTAIDESENLNRCSFLVTLLDADAPVITCPANVSATLPAGQTSTVVVYPPPAATDNRPGVTVVCIPASGSSFPAGTTTVTCTAIDAVRNSASCSFVVGVGGPELKATIPGGKTSIDFTAAAAPSRKPPKPKNSPCSFFTLANVGFTTLSVTLDSIVRTGSDVNNGRITDPNDSRYFSLSVITGDLTLTPFDIGSVLTLQPGQGQTICVKFGALIPAVAGKTSGLAAANVLPETVTSKIVFRQNGAANVEIPLLARVATGVVLIDPVNPRRPPVVTFTRNGNDIIVGYSLFDSNLDVSRAKYEFLDSSGQVVAGPFEIDLAAALSSANLVRGQSFSVEQRFTGAIDNPQVTGVRLTVFDGETSTVGSSSASASAVVASSIQLLKRARGVTLYPPALKLNPSLP